MFALSFARFIILENLIVCFTLRVVVISSIWRTHIIIRASPFRFIVHQLEVGGGDALSSSPLVYNLGGCGLLLYTKLNMYNYY